MDPAKELPVADQLLPLVRQMADLAAGNTIQIQASCAWMERIFASVDRIEAQLAKPWWKRIFG